MSSAPVLRSTRTTVFAVVCVALAAVGHVAAGHTGIAPWTLVAGFAGALAVAWALTGVERSLWSITGLMLGGQFVLHALFSAGMSGPMTAGHQPIVQPPAGHGGTAMTLAHAGAGLVAAWWLRHGERLAWGLARRTAALARIAARTLRLLAVAFVPVPAGPVRIMAEWPAERRPRSPLLEHSVVRRGPPMPGRALG